MNFRIAFVFASLILLSACMRNPYDPMAPAKSSYLPPRPLKLTPRAVANTTPNDHLQVIETPRNVRLILSNDFFFSGHSAEIDPRAYDMLQTITHLLKNYPHAHITITSHTDDMIHHDHLLTLSQQRADSLTAYFWAHGIDEENLSRIPAGPNQPVANNKSVKGQRYNRRTEILIVPQQHPGIIATLLSKLHLRY